MQKVIVVDDDYGTTSLLRMLLEMEGFEVATFTDTTRAVNAAEDGVKAFIIDCYFGQTTQGIDMLRTIRAHSDAQIRYAPVIMVSGDERLAETVLEEGADRFLLKPYSPSELTREIQALLAAGA